MSFRNIKLIYLREIRDQLRDRRGTLFMIAVLPLLLYPLLGMSVFQLSQFLRKNESRIVLLGAEQLTKSTDLPPLVTDGQFSEDFFDDPAEAQRLKLETVDAVENQYSIDTARARLKSGDLQVVVQFPADFAARLTALRATLQSAGKAKQADTKSPDIAPDQFRVPEPEILYNSSREKSDFAHHVVERVLNNWKAQIVRQTLVDSHVPADVAKPFQVKPLDVAEKRQQEAVVWAKILPFVLFIWALTGAFYPAVDLCAGEKERGTLETLLSSPALRSEIVWGKLLTVMTFSVATALLNLTSLGVTAQYVVTQLKSVASNDSMHSLYFPPLPVIACMFAAFVPMSALFSALCLACAAFARSTKEGQYYLMPLLLVTLPLMMLPMSPGVELNLGNSLIPISGVVLLLRALVEGNYADALPYIAPVCGMTLVCCLLAIRWAEYQFNQESVLFRESERLDLRRWIVQLVRERQDTPSLAEAFFCVALIFVIQFFTRIAIASNAPADPDFHFLTLLLFISQVVCIALPALLMTLLFTERPLKTLLLDRPPRLAACISAIALAVFVHPVGQQLAVWIQHLYPVQENVAADTTAFARLLESSPNVWLPFVLIALLPAVCEEVAFRGFILSGLRHVGHKWWAICLAAVFFGMAHTVVQQSLAAVVLGLVIGFVAVQTGSLIPGMLFHATYNSLMLVVALTPQYVTHLADRWPVVKSLYADSTAGDLTYRTPVIVLSAAVAAAVLVWFHRQPVQATKEERLSDARALQSQQLVTGSVD